MAHVRWSGEAVHYSWRCPTCGLTITSRSQAKVLAGREEHARVCPGSDPAA